MGSTRSLADVEDGVDEAADPALPPVVVLILVIKEGRPDPEVGLATTEATTLADSVAPDIVMSGKLGRLVSTSSLDACEG